MADTSSAAQSRPPIPIEVGADEKTVVRAHKTFESVMCAYKDLLDSVPVGYKCMMNTKLKRKLCEHIDAVMSLSGELVKARAMERAALLFANEQASVTKSKVLRALKQSNVSLSANDLATLLRVNEAVIETHLKVLVAEGMAVPVHSSGKDLYYCSAFALASRASKRMRR